MSTYTSNIPQPGDNPSQSQDQILQNFQSISSLISNNHVPFNDASQGKHKFLQMPEQGSAPATAVNEGAIYSRESSLTSNTEMVFKREDNGAEIEFTSSQGATNGWSFLPSGILLKWGTGTGTGLFTINFPTGATIPVFGVVYNGIGAVEDPGSNPDRFVTIISTSTTGITVYGSSRTKASARQATFRYLVIGS